MEKNSYYDEIGVSQSLLKKYAGTNPQVYELPEDDALWYTEKKHFMIGDGVDMLLSDPDLFPQLMHVSELTEEQKPTGKSLGVVHLAYEKYKEEPASTSITFFQGLVWEASRELEWNPKWGQVAIVKAFTPYYDYFLDLIKAQGKIVLTVEDNDKITSIVMAIRTHKNTAQYFIPSNDTVIITQMAIYWEREFVPCKALLDHVIINHKNLTIQPIDYKTMGDTIYSFPKVLKQRRYDIQAAWYTLALQEYIKQNSQYQNYTILPFKFIVASTTDHRVVPIVYTCSDALLNIGKNGCPEIIQEILPGKFIMLRNQIKGYEQLWEDYLIYDEIGFDVHLDLLEGDVTLDWK